MDTVKVGNFPSTTNWRNFWWDISMTIPSLPFDIDHGEEAMVIQVQYYEENKNEIDDFAKQSGGDVT